MFHVTNKETDSKADRVPFLPFKYRRKTDMSIKIPTKYINSQITQSVYKMLALTPSYM